MMMMMMSHDTMSYTCIDDTMTYSTRIQYDILTLTMSRNTSVTVRMTLSFDNEAMYSLSVPHRYTHTTHSTTLDTHINFVNSVKGAVTTFVLQP